MTLKDLLIAIRREVVLLSDQADKSPLVRDDDIVSDALERLKDVFEEYSTGRRSVLRRVQQARRFDEMNDRTA